MHQSRSPADAGRLVSPDCLAVLARVRRLTEPADPHPATRPVALAAAAALAVIPLLLYALPG